MAIWYEPKSKLAVEQCPCCGYITLPERGTSLICPICFWEDDAFIGNALHEFSICNKLTLLQARQNFSKFGACDVKMLPYVLPKEARESFSFKPFFTQ